MVLFDTIASLLLLYKNYTMEGYNKETKQYNTFALQFGWNMTASGSDTPKKRIDKRTKKYGKQRSHSGKLGAYK